MSAPTYRFEGALSAITHRRTFHAGLQAYAVIDNETARQVAYVAFYAPSGPELPPAPEGVVAGFDLFRMNPLSAWIAQGDIARDPRSGALVISSLEVRPYADEILQRDDPMRHIDELIALGAGVDPPPRPPRAIPGISSDVLRSIPLGIVFEALSALARTRSTPELAALNRAIWGQGNWLDSMPRDDDLTAPRRGRGRPGYDMSLLRDVAIAAINDSNLPGRNGRLADKFDVEETKIRDLLRAARKPHIGWLAPARAGSRNLQPGPRMLQHTEGDQ